MKALRFYFTAMFCLSLIYVSGQTWQVTWDKEMGNNKMDYFADVIEDVNEGFTVLGSIFTKTSNSYDFWLVRFNTVGDTIWSKTFGTTNNEIPKKLVQNEDGSYLVVGVCQETNSDKLVVFKTDTNGIELWQKKFDDNFYYSGNDLISIDNETVLLVGSKSAEKENPKLWMAKLDKSGNVIWENQFANDINGNCKSIKKLPVGGFAIASEVVKNGSNDSDILVMRTNAEMNVLWETRVPSVDLKVWPECVCCSPDSCFMVVGWQGTSLNGIDAEEPIFDYDLVLVKLDCTGKVLWTKNFDREGSEGGNAVTIRPDGNFVVAGIKATSFLGKIGPWLMLVDPNGKLISETLIELHFNFDQAIKVINSSDGGIIVIGPGFQDESYSRSNGWIMKFASL